MFSIEIIGIIFIMEEGEPLKREKNTNPISTETKNNEKKLSSIFVPKPIGMFFDH
jgi:hypothetical protein